MSGPLFEVFLLLAIISVMVFIALFYFSDVVKESKETALEAELRNIRAAILAYFVQTGSFPPDLRTLTLAALPGERNRPHPTVNILSCRLSPESEPLDPWQNRYSYDPSDGTVHSATPGYEDW